MKGIMIIYAPALEDNVLAALAAVGAAKYTKFPLLHGVGGHSEPHLDTQVWPGTNEALLVVTDDATKTKLMAEIAKLKKEFSAEGIKAFVLPVEEEI
ncbi:MAG: PG0541 family transporter-associated protein [Candidatus Margulisiibacteriota bacterium]